MNDPVFVRLVHTKRRVLGADTAVQLIESKPALHPPSQARSPACQRPVLSARPALRQLFRISIVDQVLRGCLCANLHRTTSPLMGFLADVLVTLAPSWAVDRSGHNCRLGPTRGYSSVRRHSIAGARKIHRSAGVHGQMARCAQIFVAFSQLRAEILIGMRDMSLVYRIAPGRDRYAKR
jgi:hypothetical protein